MSKFQVGDKVRRIAHPDGRGMVLGRQYIVQSVSSGGEGNWLALEGYNNNRVHDRHPYCAEYFKLVQPTAQLTTGVPTLTPTADSQAVLTPLKVFECILAGTPLEYRVKASDHGDHGDWYPLKNPKYTNLRRTDQCDFRVKPQPVQETCQATNKHSCMVSCCWL